MPGVTLCRHAELGVEVNQPTDALAAFVARGWEPIGESRSEEDANQERVDAENAAALHVADVVEILTSDEHLTVAETLAEVGDDPETASAALAVEQSHENPRTTLVARLNQITNPAGDAGTTERN